ncbi:MAG: leucine--tRNA ligase [Spirochaetota bacterium]|nr:leucine--tRNA ligase [Spirochaetota bacterium]
MAYDFKSIEQKWQKYWSDNNSFKVTEDLAFPKEKRAYLLDMFPYPSGNGLHVGHPEGYTATDIYGRYLRMKGFNVLHPMGYDSFGLPAEQYALKTGIHPLISTEQNIINFERQIKSLGFAYDWDRKVCTHNADYYKWTQFIFLKLFEKGLAYEAQMPVNWCEESRTVLANEEVVNGKCERTGYPVIKKNLRQWVLKITAYADRLIEDLDLCDWPDSIKSLQKNWIGRSNGAEIIFTEENSNKTITVYTTRPDTLYGATYIVLSPGHKLVSIITTDNQKKSIQEYIIATQSKNDMERTELNKEKSGVFTGAFAINPINNQKIPIWIGDYVLETYGTGAVMAVPAHDERDYTFAKKYDLPIIPVVSPDGTNAPDLTDNAYTQYGFSFNSEKLSGLETKIMQQKIIEKLEAQQKGKAKVQYKLRDWIFSRQRFWGEPIPLVHCSTCGIVPVPESELPVLLPNVKKFFPASTGESPLAEVEEWVNTSCPKCGIEAKRETNTMPQWAGSCWYYLRYIDPTNTQEFISKEKEEYWMPVNLYVGGQEHAVLHLLYARFWHKVLFDCGLVSTKEPFHKLVNQGMILGENNEKMSKSRGNVVNPDDVVAEFGADSLRLYEMFMGPLEMGKPWSMNGIKGIKKFLDRVWRLFEDHEILSIPMSPELLKLTHKTIKKVSHDIETINQFNTAISAMMILVNELTTKKEISRDCLEILAKLLAPFAPHMGEELWEILGHPPLIANQKYPEYDELLTIDDEIEFVIQINGKSRDKIIVAKNLSKEELEKKGLELVKDRIQGKEIIKCIVVPNKLLNVVVK